MESALLTPSHDDVLPPDDSESSQTAVEMAAELARIFGPAALAVIHYGSRARGDARADSAYDFFVIVEDYRTAYESAARETELGVRARTATALAHVLSPNVHALPPVPAGGRRNKCGVLTLRELETAARLEAADHFVTGRLFQEVQLLWTKSPAHAKAVEDALEEIRSRTFEWGRCYLPDVFDVDTYCRTLLETSFAAEIRPESSDRAVDLFEAQRPFLVRVYGLLLEELARDGVLVANNGQYRQVDPPSPRMRSRWDRYFRVSKTRGTVRWGKAIAQYDGWLDYIVQKITRHNDVQVELTERERKWPFIFLWPKVFQFFRNRSSWETRR